MKNRDLIKQLHTLKSHQAAGAPDETWVSANREIMMSQIRPQVSAQEVPVASGDMGYYFRYFQAVMTGNVMRPAAMAVLVVLAMLGYSATSSIASASLPGDLLYPVKTATERVQLALTFSEEKKVSLQMDFVVRRTDEMQQIAVKSAPEAQKARQVAHAAQQIADSVKSVDQKLAQVQAASADKGAELAKVVDTKTLVVTEGLVAAHTALSEPVKQAVANDVQEAVAATDDAGTDALAVLVGTYQSGSSAVSDAEVTTRVTDRINKIEQTAAMTAQKATSTATSTSAAVTASTTAQIALDKEAIAEVRTLVERKDFATAVEKLKLSTDSINAVATLPLPTVTNSSSSASTTTSTKPAATSTSSTPPRTGSTP